MDSSYSAALRQSIADAVAGLAVFNVASLQVTDVATATTDTFSKYVTSSYGLALSDFDESSPVLTNNRNKRITSKTSKGDRRLAEESVYAQYNILISTSKGLSATYIVDQLNNSITSGEFNHLLQQNAISYGATEMADSTSSGLTAYILLDPVVSKSNGSSYTPGAIAGIILGVLVCIGIVVLIIAYCIPNIRIFDEDPLAMSSLIQEQEARNPIHPKRNQGEFGNSSNYFDREL